MRTVSTVALALVLVLVLLTIDSCVDLFIPSHGSSVPRSSN